MKRIARPPVLSSIARIWQAPDNVGPPVDKPSAIVPTKASPVGAWRMAGYRLCFLAGGGRIARPPQEFEAADDALAIARAEAHTLQPGGHGRALLPGRGRAFIQGWSGGASSVRIGQGVIWSSLDIGVVFGDFSAGPAEVSALPETST
jgi:hypothetical protein